MSNPLLAPIIGYASRLRFPTLFLVIAGLFVFDVIIPDFIPFLDEIMLGLGTVLLASWKNRKASVETTNSKPPIEGEFKKD
ncbi:MAG TPA: hypothetical protein PKI87_02700 [Arenimonas sp.]|nr:hypothetical protein [Arenimonas sp.]